MYDEGSVPDFPPGGVSSSAASLSLLAPPQDVADVCGSLPSTSTQPGSLTCDVDIPSPPSPILVDPSQSCSQVPSLGSSVLSDSPISSSPLPPSSPCLDGASPPPGAANLPSGPSVPSSDHDPSPSPLHPPPTTSPSPSSWSQPVTPLSVSPCDSPSARMLLLGSPPPSFTATPVLPPRVCRPVPLRISRSAKNVLRHRIIHGAVPCDSGNPVSCEDQPRGAMGRVVAPPAASVASPSDLSSPVVGRQCVAGSPVGNTPSSTYSDLHSVAPDPPVSPCATPPVQPFLKLTPGLSCNDLCHNLTTAVGPCDRSEISCNLRGVSDRNPEKRSYLDARIKDLENMKRVCVNTACSGDECPSIQSIPSSGCSPPPNNSLLHPPTTRDVRRVVFRTETVNSASTLNDDVAKRARAEENRLNALAILRRTFSTSSVPPSRPSCITTSASSLNHSDACSVSTSVVRPCPDHVVAPPPLAARRRNVFLRTSDVCNAPVTASQLIASALRKLRPRPQSESDEDSRFDPCSPAPPSPELSDHSGDEDCAVDVRNLECVQSRTSHSAALSVPSQADSHLHDVDDDAAIPSAQPRLPRPPDKPPPGRSNPRVTPPPQNDLDDRDAVDDDDVDVFNDSQQLPVEGADQQRLVQFRERWIATFSSDLSWDDFSRRCEDFATESRDLASELSRPLAQRPNPAGTAQSAPPPPAPRRPAMGRPARRFDPVAARRIQGLYRHSKKRAARKLLSDNQVQYSGTVDAATQYFTNVFDEKHANPNVLGESLNLYVKNAKDHELSAALYDDISEKEIAAKLRSAANTAPGADRCEYAHLKRVDPGGKILAVLFNRCQREKDVPAAWKLATTVLIYKKGDDADVSNFRPISLMSVIYKLFMGVMAKRLTSWSIDAGVLSDEQKSARPSEGCYEHTYLLKSLVADARRRKKKLFLAWLDIRNAFGSVPHATIRSVLRHIGVPADLVTLVLNAYTGATSVIRTPQGDTPAIPLRAGVKQGCPLSPILFNLCIELILRMVKAKASKLKSGACVYHGLTISCLAYADDLVIIARSARALQDLLDQASDGATILGLSFRPDKCASLSLVTDGRATVRTATTDLTIQGEHFPALENEESYRYLGVPIGLIHNIDDIPNIVPRLIRDLEVLRVSLLAPWQKLDAIRTFLQPCLTYALRAGNPLKKSLHEYRALLLKAVRDICSLPTRASASYIFAGKYAGGLAFQDPTVESDLQAIVQAIRILSSPDTTISTIAQAELKAFVRSTTQSAPTAELISQYLSAAEDPRLDHLSYSTHSSLWSRVRMACRRQRVGFVFSETNPPHVSADGSDGVVSKNISFFLHRLVQQRSAADLMSLNDQGKVARCMVADQYGNGSSWHMNGLNIRFKDWRFIHRARLNVLPLNATKSRFSHTDPTCRHCCHPETLPHVLCHCRPEMTLIRDRHNKIVERIVKAVRFGEITTDRAVRESGLRLRPDIIVKDQRNVLIIDVTCPFDNDSRALAEAAEHKFNKYIHLKEHFISRGLKCDIFPFVIGALGSWYPKNELLCSQLGMTRRYKSLFRKLCCSDAIQGSTDIYRLHLGWDDRVPDVPSAS